MLMKNVLSPVRDHCVRHVSEVGTPWGFNSDSSPPLPYPGSPESGSCLPHVSEVFWAWMKEFHNCYRSTPVPCLVPQSRALVSRMCLSKVPRGGAIK